VITSRIARSFTIALTLTGVLTGRAAAQSPTRFGLATGATVPVSGYGSDKNVGYHIELLLDVRMPESPLGFQVSGAFHELGYAGNSTKQDIWLANANILLKAPIQSSLVPYATAGAGMYNSHRTLFLGSHSSTDPGFNFGGGVRFEMHDATSFLEARYHKVSGEGGIRILPITIGIIF
jgi:Outer membrane protein beta-barrel domain